LFFGVVFSSFAQTRSLNQEVNAVQKYYPNPATSIINFELSKTVDQQCTLQVYNFMGRKVYEVIPTIQLFTISLDGFYRGVYIYQLRNKSGKIIDSGKFQVVK
jgi:hypothetical protein